MPTHQPAKSGIWFFICIGTDFAPVTNIRQNLRNCSELVFGLRIIPGCDHFSFLPSIIVEVTGG